MVSANEQPAAGRDLDALIAEKVMGLVVTETVEETSYSDPAGTWQGEYYGAIVQWATPPGQDEADIDVDDYLRSYSTDIGAAWEVVEKLLTLGVWVERIQALAPGMWRCIFEGRGRRPGYGTRAYQATGDTAPHAICLAALEAVKDMT